MHTLYVTHNHNYHTPNHFSTITSAIESLPIKNNIPTIIKLEEGVYYEKVVINRPNIMIIGESPQNTIITNDDYANHIMSDGKKMGTFRSYTMFIDANNVTLKHLKICNSSAPRCEVGQAIALYADGDNLYIHDCHLIGNQDTLFTGPLPPSPYEPGGFTGPKEFSPRINGRQLYEKCYICGDIDFIFGSATAYFKECTIESLNNGSIDKDENGMPIYGYISAASTPKGQKYGYIFEHCSFLSKDCPSKSIYLARPWRNYAQSIFINCFMDDCIHPAGFHDWNKTEAHTTVCYGEYNNHGKGADTDLRASFSHTLSEKEADMYTLENVLNSSDY